MGRAVWVVFEDRGDTKVYVDTYHPSSSLEFEEALVVAVSEAGYNPERVSEWWPA